MSTEFNKVKSGVTFTKAAQKQDLQSGDTIPEALGKLAKYMDVTDDALSNIQPILTFDSEPKYESLNPVTSGGLYDYIELQSPTYINTFSTESDLYNYSGNLTNNDYAFVGTGSGATYYMSVYQYKSEVIRDTIENIKTVPSGSNILKTLNEPALPSGNIQYKLDCYVTAVNNQSYGTSPVITVIFSDNTTAQVTVPNANKTHIVKTYSKTIKAIQFMTSGQASDGYTDFEDIQILTTAGWNKLSYRLYNPTWNENQLSAINSGITSTKVTNYDNHIANKSNPHEVTKIQVGLGNVGNFKAVSTEASQGLTNTEQSNARTNINAQESLSFNGTYNASTNKVATESTVTNAINALDVSSQGGAGKYISEISETNGKISATPTTMDTSLSNSSTNNNCPTSKTVYNDQQRQDAALVEVENKGAKNLFPNNAASQTVGGVTFTVNSDGSITANGAKTNNDWFILSTDNKLKADTYVLSSGLTPQSDMNIRVIITTTNILGSAIMATEGERQVHIKQLTSDYTGLYYAIRISSGATVNNIVFKPMICTKAEWDISQDYVPYGKTNAKLTAENISQQSEIDYAVNTGVKNLFDINTSLPLKIYHTTYTLSDGSLTVTSNGSWGHHSVPVNLPAGNYIFTATISNFSKDSSASATSVRMRVTDTTATGGIETASKAVTGNGAFELPFTWTGGQCYIQYYPNYTSTTTYVSSFTASNNMIRPAKITDPTYEPYALPNPTLTPAVIKAVDEGAKNLLHFDQLGYSTVQGMSMVHRGVTFTLTDDTVVCSGTNDNTDNSHCRLYIGSDRVYVTDLCDGNHILSGTPSGGGAEKWSMSAHYGVSGVTQYNRSDYGEGVLLTEPSESGYNILIDISISKGQNASGLIFKPMICTAADWAVSQKFVPYCQTNRELYETKATVDDIYGVGIVIPDNSDLNNYKTPGSYYVGNSASAATIVNIPLGGSGFRLIVRNTSAGNRYRQEFIKPNNPETLYVRHFTTSGTWSPWYKFEGTEVTS